jgi:hypothetical protein
MSLTFTKTLVPVLSVCIASCSSVNSGSIAPAAADPSQTSSATLRQANATVTDSGTVAAMIKGGFTLWSSNCGYVHVFVTSSTKMSGPAPTVHSTASVTGAGSCATSINASSVSVKVAGASGAGAPVVSGTCTMFPAGDPTYNRNISTASIDPHSASYIASMQQAGDTASFYASTGVERANLATSSTPLLTVSRKVSYHSFPLPYPWTSSFYIEPLGDAHAIVVQTQSCRLYEAFDTTYSGGKLSAYSGANWDLTKPYVPLPPGTPSAMASGLSLFAGMVSWTDYQSGSIRHPLNWAAITGTVSKLSFVAPASATDQMAFRGSSSYQLPYGARLRLKASFSTAGWGPQSTMVAQAMKNYGILLADTGSSGNALYFANESNGTNPWSYSDLSALSKINLSDFDVLTLPTIQNVR